MKPATRIFRQLLSGALAGALATAVPAQAQDGPPPPLPLEPVSFPSYHERTLSNGADVIVVENPEQPVVSVNLRIRSGNAYDPSGTPGVAAFTASLLDKGTESRDGRTIAETVDFTGAILGANAGQDWTSVGVTSLTEFLDTALVLLSDVVRNPTFPEDELETERTRTLTGLEVELSQPGSVAGRRFIENLYGDHPYGSQPTPESVRRIERADLVEFHDRHYRPGNALFVVAGDVRADEIIDALEHHFGDWRGGAPPPIDPADPPARAEREILLYHKPGAVQAVVRVGHLMPPATHPDWVPLEVAVQIVGGGGTGWLFDVLRQQRGYTYGAYAGLDRAVGPGYFQAVAEVRNEVVDSAMIELFALLDSIRTGIPPADLRLAQDYVTGSFPRQIETPQQVSSQIASTRLYGLPPEYLEEYRSRVAALDVERVREVAREQIHPERSLVVVVGDATQILDALESIGPVRLFDVEGEPLSRADLEVRAAEVAFDPSGVQPMTLVSALHVQDNPIGDFTTTITRENRDGREVIRDVRQGGGMGLTIDQELVFDAADFTPISFRMEQQAGPQRVAAELAYSDGRLTGITVDPAGDTTRIDTAVVEGTLLPGMDRWALMLADLEANPELRLPAFNAQSATAYTFTARVVGDTTVTVPAGEFEAYRIEMSTDQGSFHILVRKEAPHIILRQEFAAQPIVIELKEVR